MKKINAYLLNHPNLLLALVWVFVALAVIPGTVAIILVPGMSYFKFLGIIIVPAAIALYLRVLYTRVQDKKKEARQAQKAAENEARHPHKKKR